MRLKHILLPIAAALMLGGYFTFEAHQKAQFDSQAWIERVDEEGEYTRQELLPYLVSYVLKVGMLESEVDKVLGKADSWRGPSSHAIPDSLGAELIYGVYYKQKSYLVHRADTLSPIYLDLHFSESGKLSHFEVDEGPKVKPVYFY